MSQQDPKNPSGHQPPSDPNRPNQDYTNASPPDQISAQEVAKLKRNQQEINLAQQKVLFSRIESSVFFLVGMLEILLMIRFFLRLSGANPENMFAQFIDGLSKPFVKPFSTLFISPTGSTSGTIGVNIFDVNLIIAMIIYALLCFLTIWIVRYIYEQISPGNTKY